MARRTRNRSPLSTHYRTEVGGVDALAHKALIRGAIAKIEAGADALDVLVALPGYAVVEWETGEPVSDVDDLLAWFEVTEPDAA